ncbi:MAG: hypothetical protein CSA13_01315 [Clostridiales bacterium]|nr:MAG: hypothetical protein CSA13_01315 [Clostridiales bacterium]
MKKISLLLIVIISLIMATGCAEKAKPQTEVASETEQTTAEVTTTSETQTEPSSETEQATTTGKSKTKLVAATESNSTSETQTEVTSKTEQSSLKTTKKNKLAIMTTDPNAVKSTIASEPQTKHSKLVKLDEEDIASIRKKRLISDEKLLKLDRLYGGWQSSAEGGSYYVFHPDGRFYWYKSSADLDDNYYTGTTSYLVGFDATDDLGLDSSAALIDLPINSEGKVTILNVYSISMKANRLISGGIDKSDTLGEDFIFKMLFIYIDENNAQAYNFNTGDKYYLIKDDEPLKK